MLTIPVLHLYAEDVADSVQKLRKRLAEFLDIPRMILLPSP